MERFDPVELEKLQWLQKAWREAIDSGDAGEIDFSELKQETRRRLGNLDRHQGLTAVDPRMDCCVKPVSALQWSPGAYLRKSNVTGYSTDSSCGGIFATGPGVCP
jgi:hypothetical protein